jgi:hypothetical protein
MALKSIWNCRTTESTFTTVDEVIITCLGKRILITLWSHKGNNRYIITWTYKISINTEIIKIFPINNRLWLALQLLGFSSALSMDIRCESDIWIYVAGIGLAEVLSWENILVFWDLLGHQGFEFDTVLGSVSFSRSN